MCAATRSCARLCSLLESSERGGPRPLHSICCGSRLRGSRQGARVPEFGDVLTIVFLGELVDTVSRTPTGHAHSALMFRARGKRHSGKGIDVLESCRVKAQGPSIKSRDLSANGPCTAAGPGALATLSWGQ
jgi:hypothetical protein